MVIYNAIFCLEELYFLKDIRYAAVWLFLHFFPWFLLELGFDLPLFL